VLANDCTWGWFITSAGWFGEIEPDLGLAVLRADGRSLAVLAATNAD
jgi:hypothetical protein